MSGSSPVRFSIVIPTYNRAGFILNAVESALAQEYPNFEVIVVDDGSTDGTERLFASWRRERVSYYRTENAERGAARNFGARKSTGEYLNFLDSDDLLLPNHLAEAARCVQALARPEVFATGYRVEDGEGRLTKVVSGLPDPLNERLLSGNILSCNGVFVRKDVFERRPFDETRALAGTEDWLLWLALAARFPFRYWDRVTTTIIDHGGRSVIACEESKLVGRGQALIESLKADPEFMRRYGDRLAGIRAFRDVYTALHLAASGQSARPLSYLYRAARTSPRALWRKTTLGTVKHLLLNAIRK